MSPHRHWYAQPQGKARVERMRGESLIGLLIGLALGLGVLTGGISLWMVTLKAQRSALQENRMHQDLRAAMDWMAQEIRQAQYLHQAWKLRTTADCSDAFCGAPEDFSISGNQIEFSWDRDDDGTKDNNECNGFQLREFELRTKTSCTSGQWQVVTNAEDVKITSLKFTPRCTWVNDSLLRHIDIQLTATLPNDPLTVVTHQQSVQLRNAQPASAWPGSCS
jgi:type II secretory pathway component PulJ